MTGRLEVRQVSKRYASARGAVTAIEQVSLTIGQGEFVALVGPSGCGKSTLLRLIDGLIEPDTGSIRFEGWGADPQCCLVFQDGALFPWMSVVDNVAFGLETQGVPRRVRRGRALSQLETMGLADFAGHYPHELSGGMRQRAAIARAFIRQPDVLLMDEPLRALDAQMQLLIQQELLALWARHRPTVVYVTHDIEEALLLSDRVFVMSSKPGRILTTVVPPFGRPRDLTDRSPDELRELKWHIWNLLEQEVRASLGLIAEG